MPLLDRTGATSNSPALRVDGGDPRNLALSPRWPRASSLRSAMRLLTFLAPRRTRIERPRFRSSAAKVVADHRGSKRQFESVSSLGGPAQARSSRHLKKLLVLTL